MNTTISNALKQAVVIATAIAMIWLVGSAMNNLSKDEATGTEASEFDRMLNAIEWVESKWDADAIGDGGNAIGSFQIWKIYVDDVNRILKLQGSDRKYFYRARQTRSSSREMVTIYLKHYGGTIEEMARKHNGGPQGHKKKATEKYWLKVKARMEL